MNDPKKSPEEILSGQMKEGETNERLATDPGNALDDAGEEAESDLLETAQPAQDGRGEDDEVPCEACGSDPQVLGVSDRPDEDPHSHSEEDARAKLLELQGELNRLEEQIAERRATYARLERECAEFRELYPGLSLSDLPDKVWEDVQNGIPMAAAFALSERKRMILEAEAERTNRENKKVAPEGLYGSEEIYFSPAEVRSMTQAEVKKNYEKIIQSMEKWN